MNYTTVYIFWIGYQIDIAEVRRLGICYRQYPIGKTWFSHPMIARISLPRKMMDVCNCDDEI